MTTQLRLVIAGLLFVLIFATGYWLSRLERPRNTILLTVHKLTAVGAVVFLALSVNPLRGTAGLGTWAIVAIAATSVFFVLTIASGGVLSADRPETTLISLGHKLTPYLTVLSAAASVYLLLNA